MPIDIDKVRLAELKYCKETNELFSKMAKESPFMAILKEDGDKMIKRSAREQSELTTKTEREMSLELKIQDEANDILTSRIAELERFIYPPAEISEWRKWTVCCHDKDTANAADQAIAKCTQYFNAKIEELAMRNECLEQNVRGIEKKCNEESSAKIANLERLLDLAERALAWKANTGGWDTDCEAYEEHNENILEKIKAERKS